jgi:hypothetical protein
VVSGAEEKSWCRFKLTLSVYDPSWKQKGVDHVGWFTWTNYKQHHDRV